MANETAADSVEEPTSPPARARLKRAASWYAKVSDVLPPKRIGLLLGALLIGLVGLFGGWSTVTEADDDTPTAEVGSPVDTNPFEVTVRTARNFEELQPTFRAEDGFRYLAVSMDVTNTTAEPVSASTLIDGTSLDVVGLRTTELASGPVVNRPQVVRASDSLSQRTFQPDLTTNVVLVWQQDLSQAVTDELTLTLSQHTLRRSTLDGQLGWRDPEAAWLVTVPLEPVVEQ